MNAKQIITSNKTILAAALLTLGLTGCAITPATESLKYTPQSNVQRIAGAENISVNVVTTDSRVDKVIANKVNAFNMKMAGISADEPVERIVNRAIEQELKSRGFMLNKNGGFVIQADVTKFYNDRTAGFVSITDQASADFDLSLSNGKSIVYTGKIHGIYTESQALVKMPNDSSFVEKALANAITNLFNDTAFITALSSISPSKTAGN
jgi:uncharacterized lipoprotein YajG